MYTVEGVRRTAWRLTGRKPWIIEHFAVDPNSPACRNPALYRRLYGEDPYRFFLLLPQGTFEKQQDMEHFLERMSQLLPAETEMELVLLKPCNPAGLAHLSGHQLPDRRLHPRGHRRLGDHPL